MPSGECQWVIPLLPENEFLVPSCNGAYNHLFSDFLSSSSPGLVCHVYNIRVRTTVFITLRAARLLKLKAEVVFRGISHLLLRQVADPQNHEE